MFSSKLSQRSGLILLIAGLVVHTALTLKFNFTQDDAFITFRYAINFLNGDGLVYNIGERVEGYTNFLWLIIMILGHLAGLSFILLSKILGIACGLGTIIVSYLISLKIFNSDRFLAGLSSLLLGSILSFAYWSVSGLETAAFSLMVASAFNFYLDRNYLLLPVLAIAALLRPEGAFVAAILILYEIIRQKQLSRYAITILIGLALLLIPYVIFKLYYFHSLLPNSFYAKTGFNLSQFLNGFEYTGLFFWHYLAAGLFLVPLLMRIKRWTAPVKFMVIFLGVYFVYIIIIGGDVLKVHRFFVPLLALLIPIVVYGIAGLLKKQYLVIVSAVIILGWQLYMPYKNVTSFHYGERMLIKNMGEMIDQLKAVDHSDFSLAVSTIGIVGYKLIGHQVIDLLGLTDSTIARHPEKPIKELETTWKESKYNSKYLLSRQPDYILFSTALKPSAPAERALFLYPQFLNCYRTIGFIYGGAINDIYKRFLPIAGELEPTIDPEFVQSYNLGLNQMGARDYIEAIKSFRKAWALCPEPKYPYVYYMLSKIERLRENYIGNNQMLDELVKRDTLMYYTYKDLYIIESLVKFDREKAALYRQKLLELVPWYVPDLDSTINATLKKMGR